MLLAHLEVIVRQFIRCRFLSLCLCMVMTGACQKGTQSEPKAAAAPAVGVEGVPPSELAPRRDRAGLDLGERSERPSAAQLIAAPPSSTAPPVQEGPDAQRSRDALTFVLTRWLPAVRGDDEVGYRGLLNTEFKGVVPGEDLPVNATRWISIGAMTTHQPKEIGPVQIHPMPGPLARVTVSFHALQAKGPCAVVPHELTLQPQGDKGLQVMVSSLGEPILCSDSLGLGAEGGLESVEHQVRSAHSALKASWKAGDKKETLAGLSPPVFIREHGREVASYDAEAVTGAEGRWMLDELKGAEVTEVSVVLPWAVISGSGPGVFVYRWSGERWKLVGRSRTDDPGV